MTSSATVRRKPVSRTRQVRDLNLATRQAMWALYSTYYADTSEETFLRDLTEKDDVILATDPADGAICGFTTLKMLDVQVEGRRVFALFSGDTILRPEFWGQRTMHRAFASYLLQAKLRRPFSRLYWFLLSKGYRTYLVMSRNWTDYWPRHDRPTPAFERAVLDTLGRSRYPNAWHSERGLLVLPHGQGRLKEDVAPIDEHLLAMPDVRFFIERNPGYARGDELCCLGLIDFLGFAAYALKVSRRAKEFAARQLVRFRGGS